MYTIDEKVATSLLVGTYIKNNQTHYIYWNESHYPFKLVFFTANAALNYLSKMY